MSSQIIGKFSMLELRISVLWAISYFDALELSLQNGKRINKPISTRKYFSTFRV